jgi:hypothetical protein
VAGEKTLAMAPDRETGRALFYYLDRSLDSRYYSGVLGRAFVGAPPRAFLFILGSTRDL